MGGLPDGGSVSRGMRVRRVGAHRHVDGDGNVGAVRLHLQAARGEPGIGDAIQAAADGFPKAHVARLQRFVHFAAGLFGRPEAPVGQHGLHVFAGASRDGDFEIVDRRRTVQHKARDILAAHQVKQDGRQSALDHMTAQTPQNGPLAQTRVLQCIHHGAQAVGRQQVRQSVDEARALLVRLREMRGRHLAAPLLDRDGP